MKKILVAAIILLTSVSAFSAIKEEKAATAKFKVTTNLSAKKASLTFIPSGNEKVVVTILDANGVLIYKEQMNEVTGFTRPFDLSKIEATDFTIVVKEGNKEYTQQISLTETISTTATGMFKATATQTEAGKVELRILQTEVSPVTVAIKNIEGHVLYNVSITNEASFIQKFDISGVNEKISFEVRSTKATKTIEL